MFKVHKDPYNEIGKFIRDHLTVIEDIIAVIEINGIVQNELFMVDLDEDGCFDFVWKHDWWEGEENITLLDFFSVSDAQSPSAEQQYEPVTAEDFAKTMSENTLYSYMAWYGKPLELIEREGFVICKKTK